MINEKEILRQEEIDFRGIINRFKRGWPIIALSLGFWLFIGLVFQLTFPPRFTAKTTLLIDKPKGINDPGVMISRSSTFLKPDDYYYNNQKVAYRSLPLIKKAIEQIGTITYVKAGLFDRDIFQASPFVVEFDSTFMAFKRNETPFGVPFYVNFENYDGYHVEAEGEYGITKAEFLFEGDFQFGEWVTFDNTRFRILPADTISNPDIVLQDDIFEEDYGFILKDINALALDYVSAMEIEQEELESTAYMISLAGGAPKKQIAFLDALNQAFIDDHLEQKTKALKLALSYLEEEIETTRKNLTANEAAIETFKTSESITSLNQEGALLLDQSVKLENDKVGYVVKDRYYKYLEDYLRKGDDYSSLISPQAFGVKDELINRLTAELIDLQQDLNALESQNAQANPAYNQIKSRISQNRQTILNSVEGFKQSNQMMLENIDGRILELGQTVKDLPKAQRELLELERFFKINEQLYLTFLDKKSEAEINLVSTSSDFRVVEPAYLTTVDPTMPWLPVTVIGAFVLGLFFAFSYLIVKWLLNSRLDTGKDVYKFAPSADLVGELYHSNIKLPAELQNYGDSRLANQITTIFYRLLRKRPDAKVFGISSIQSGEGKTFTASMLATQVARLGYRTLALDLNFRQPELKKSFGVSQGSNLSDVMMGHVNLKEAIMPTGIKNLEIADIGIKTSMTDMEIRALHEILMALKEKYDIVIMDTAPLGNVSATLAILNSIDMPLIVSRRYKTSFQDLEDLQVLLEQNSLAEANMIVVDTFHPEINIVADVLNKRKGYIQNKPIGFFTRIKNLFIRI